MHYFPRAERSCLADRPRRVAQTAVGVGVIRCRDRASGTARASAGCSADRCLRDSEVDVHATNDHVLPVRIGDSRADRYSLAATDATPSHRAVHEGPLPGVFGQLAVSGKCGRLGAPLGIFIERLDYPTPLLALDIVNRS